MARIRTIKPSFFTDDELAEVSPLGRLLFIGLWTIADCEGRLEFRPKRLKAELLPYDDCEIVTLLTELEQRGFIHRYPSDVSECICIPGFRKHQRITGKEAETHSELPECKYGCGGETTGKQPGSIGEDGAIGRFTGKQRGNTGEASGTTGKERKGREGKGKEGDGAADKRPPFVLIRKNGEHTAITENQIAEWELNFPGVDVRNICRRLQDVTRTKPRGEKDDSLSWARSIIGQDYQQKLAKRIDKATEAPMTPHEAKLFADHQSLLAELAAGGSHAS